MGLPHILRRWLPRACGVVWVGLCGFLIAVLVDDLLQLYISPQDYTLLFGGEAAHGLWQYSSNVAYVAHGLLLMGWLLVGVLCALRRGPFKAWWALPTHIVLTLLYVV